MATEQQRIIGGFLKSYGLEDKFFERLVAAIYAQDYPHLIPGAPGGGGDLGIDIMHITIDGRATFWCITTEPKPKGKLLKDGIKVLNGFRDWKFKALDTIYLCTCGKLTNHAWQDVRKTLYDERDRLLAEDIIGISQFEVMKCDCDFVALELTTRPGLRDHKEEILRHIIEGLGVSADAFSGLGSVVPAEDESGEDIADFSEEWESTNERWPALYSKIVGAYQAIERSTDEEQILSAAESIERFIAAARMMGHEQKQKQLPAILRKINKKVWPEMDLSWSHDPTLGAFDVRLGACFVYTRLALGASACSLSELEVDAAYHFLMDNCAKGRLQGHRHILVFKLAGLLLRLLHKNANYDKVLELLGVAQTSLLADKTGRLSHEEYVFSLSVAALYIHAARYYEGGASYLETLAAAFREVLMDLDEGYWREAFGLLAMLYEHRTTEGWAQRREHFLRAFESIKIEDISTPRRATVYLRLHAVYIEFLGTPAIDAYREKLDLLAKLPKRVGEHPQLKIHRIILEMGAAFVAPWYEIRKRFLSLERLIEQMSAQLADVQGKMIKLRLLRLFLLRVFDERVLRQERFVERSGVLARLLRGGDSTSLYQYFGIQQIHLPQNADPEADAYKRLRPCIRPLIFTCLSHYARTIIPNTSLPAGCRARAALDYLDILSQAEARDHDVRLSAVFHDMIRAFEDRADETKLFHYYLARLYHRHSNRDLPKVVQHFDEFWGETSDLEKSRFATFYARALYENYIYFEEEAGKRDSLAKLLGVCREFLSTGSKRHFISCYYGIALSLQDPTSEEVSPERKFVGDLTDRLLRFSGGHDTRDRRYYDTLLGSSVYTREFHEFLMANENESYIAASLVSSMNSPEIYNAVATHLVHLVRTGQVPRDLLSVKLLYDIAVGLARGQEFYLPKYQFNRVCCDITEIQLGGPPKTAEDVRVLLSAIDELHRLRFKFIWVHKFMKKDLCEYLYAHRENLLVRQILGHPNFESSWLTLRRAFTNRLRQT